MYISTLPRTSAHQANDVVILATEIHAINDLDCAFGRGEFGFENKRGLAIAAS